MVSGSLNAGAEHVLESIRPLFWFDPLEMIMHRYIRILSAACIAVVFTLTGAAFATDTSEIARAAFQAKERGQPLVAIGLFRSCPIEWCSWHGGSPGNSGTGRAGQPATAGRPAMGSSLKGPMVSSVM